MLVDKWPYGRINSSFDYNRGCRHTIVDYSIRKYPQVRVLQYNISYAPISAWYAFFPINPHSMMFGLIFEGYHPLEQLLTSDQLSEREFFAKYTKSYKYKMRKFPEFLEKAMQYYRKKGLICS